MLLENVISIVVIDIFEHGSEVFFIKYGHGFFGIEVLFFVKDAVENLNLGFSYDGFKINDKSINLNLFLVFFFNFNFTILFRN